MDEIYEIPVESLMLECLDHSPAYSPNPSMQTAVFYAVSSLLALFHAYCFHLMFAS